MKHYTDLCIYHFEVGCSTANILSQNGPLGVMVNIFLCPRSVFRKRTTALFHDLLYQSIRRS